MGADSFSVALGAAEYVGVELDDDQVASLHQLHGWLGSESIRAGGLGPAESTRIWDRHIADSLIFSPALVGARTCVDLGSGTGLPGIPLAITHPHIEFTLLDRSGRRCDLMRRALAILDLTNCVVRQQDIAAVDDQFDAIVSRAAIPTESLMIHVKRIVRPGGGVAVLGLSRAEHGSLPSIDEQGLEVEVVRIPPEILDSGASLLRIEAT